MIYDVYEVHWAVVWIAAPLITLAYVGLMCLYLFKEHKTDGLISRLARKEKEISQHKLDADSQRKAYEDILASEKDAKAVIGLLVNLIQGGGKMLTPAVMEKATPGYLKKIPNVNHVEAGITDMLAGGRVVEFSRLDIHRMKESFENLSSQQKDVCRILGLRPDLFENVNRRARQNRIKESLRSGEDTFDAGLWMSGSVLKNTLAVSAPNDIIAFLKDDSVGRGVDQKKLAEKLKKLLKKMSRESSKDHVAAARQIRIQKRAKELLEKLK